MTDRRTLAPPVPPMRSVAAALLGGCFLWSGCDPATPAGSAKATAGGESSASAGSDAPLEVEKPSLKLDLGTETPPPIEPTGLRFRDATDASGIDFLMTSGDDANKNFPTANGSGVAMLDYDSDGDLDLYLATTRTFPLREPSKSKGSRLYRNRGNATFEDVTDEAGVAFDGFTHTAMAADVNGDGHQDLFLANYGPNVLYLNNGDGTFRDGSSGLGGEQPPWSSGAAFFDHDGDGDLDLYVSTYGVWTPEKNEFCGDRSLNIRTYCTPLRITPARDYLYLNRGDGTFEEKTSEARVLRDDGRGMGVLAMDVNLDGLIDLWVANDLGPKYLFMNKGDGTFDDVSELSGASAREDGTNQAGMGVDGEDLTGDGLPELFSTHFQNDYNTVYRNLDGQNFQDVTSATGTVQDCFPDVGWGCALVDFNLDGKPDLFVANGHVDRMEPLLGNDQPQEEKAKVWLGLGDVRFRLARDAGEFFDRPCIARGAAFGDLDEDGDVDVVLSRMDDRPAILLNESERGHWLGLHLEGTRSNRDAIGALVKVQTAGGVLHRQVKGGGSYHSSNDRRLHIGLGDTTAVEKLTIRWPRGGETTIDGPEIDRMHQVKEPAEAGAAAGTSDGAQPGPSAKAGG